MDPLTIFASVKAGIAAGKEIQSMVSDLASLFDAIDGARSEHTKKKSSPFRGSVNEEALDTFIKKKQAEDAEEQLRDVIIATRGHAAWHELLQLRVEMRKRRQEQERQEKIRKARRIERITIWGLLLAAFGAAGLLLWVLFTKFLR